MTVVTKNVLTTILVPSSKYSGFKSSPKKEVSRKERVTRAILLPTRVTAMNLSGDHKNRTKFCHWKTPVLSDFNTNLLAVKKAFQCTEKNALNNQKQYNPKDKHVKT